MPGRKAQGLTAINHDLAKAHGDGRHPVLGLETAKGVIIVGLGPGNGRIKISTIVLANDLLDEHAHLFFVKYVG